MSLPLEEKLETFFFLSLYLCLLRASEWREHKHVRQTAFSVEAEVASWRAMQLSVQK